MQDFDAVWAGILGHVSAAGFIARIALPPGEGLGVPWQLVQLAFAGDLSSHWAVWAGVRQHGFPRGTSGSTSAVNTAMQATRAMSAEIVNRMRGNRMCRMGILRGKTSASRSARRAQIWLTFTIPAEGIKGQAGGLARRRGRKHFCDHDCWNTHVLADCYRFSSRLKFSRDLIVSLSLRSMTSRRCYVPASPVAFSPLRPRPRVSPKRTSTWALFFSSSKFANDPTALSFSIIRFVRKTSRR